MRTRFNVAILGVGSLLFTCAVPVLAKTNYKQWLNEEVVWIVSRAEIEEFEGLKDDGSREEFIVRFWSRRDPTPSSERNEFREEHYRRLSYASQAFREGIPGWKTDRGRVYIINGPPDNESFFESRSVISPLRDLPSTARSPRTIVWVYHQLPYSRYYRGEIRAVFQPSGGMTRQSFALSESKTAQEKADQLAKQFFPASDPNWLEADVRYRLVMAGPPSIVNDKGAELPTAGVAEAARYMDDLLRSPGELLEELEAEAKRKEKAKEELRESIRSQVGFGTLPFSAVADTVRNPEQGWLVLLKLEIPVTALKEERIDLYSAVVGSDGGLVDEFIDSVALQASELAAAGTRSVFYTNSFSLPDGDFKVRSVIRETESGRTGYQELGVQLAGGPAERPKIGLVLLTNRIEIVQEGEGVVPTEPRLTVAPGNNLLFGGGRLLPNPSGRFRRGDFLFLICQIQNIAADHEISLSANFIKDGEIVMKLDPRVVKGQGRSWIDYGTALSLADFASGEYTLQIQVLDHESKKFAIHREVFQIQPGEL